MVIDGWMDDYPAQLLRLGVAIPPTAAWPQRSRRQVTGREEALEDIVAWTAGRSRTAIDDGS